MPNLTLRPVTAQDHAAWHALWQAYLHFYETELADAVSLSTWQRLLDPSEPTHSALAWVDGKAVGMVNFIYHRSNWSIENSCYLQDLLVVPTQRGTGVGRKLIEHLSLSIPYRLLDGEGTHKSFYGVGLAKAMAEASA